MKVVGVIPTKFPAEDTGEMICGVNVHCEYESPSYPGQYATTKFFLSDAKRERLCPTLNRGDDIEVIRNTKGKVQRVIFLG